MLKNLYEWSNIFSAMMCIKYDFERIWSAWHLQSRHNGEVEIRKESLLLNLYKQTIWFL